MHNIEENIPNRKDIIECYERIKPFVHKTPILTSKYINQISKAEVFFKCENFQKVGAFKYRGATNAVLKMADAIKNKGVATHSSGNHAQALALAAATNGIKAYIVMPKNSRQVKIDAVKGYGAEVILCEPTLQSREDTLKQVVEKTGAFFIHPYNDYNVICGQASAAFEMFQEKLNLDIIITPVGGGGLLSGTALSTAYFSERTTVFAAEPEGADDAYQSLHCGSIVPSTNPDTIADGLLTSLGEKTFEIIKNHVKEIFRVNDDEIIAAMKTIWERMKIIIEPSSAVPFAAILKYNEIFVNKRIGVIISGGNVDLKALPF